MTFVYTGNTVTFMQAALDNKGFNIEQVRNYQLPIKIDNTEIKKLPELKRIVTPPYKLETVPITLSSEGKNPSTKVSTIFIADGHIEFPDKSNC